MDFGKRWKCVLYTMMHPSQFQGLSSNNKTAVIKLKWQYGRGKTYFKLKASHSDAQFLHLYVKCVSAFGRASGSAQLIPIRFPPRKSLVTLPRPGAMSSERNKLLPFSTLRSSAFHDKSNLFGNMRRRKRVRFTFRSATGNVVIYNLRLVAGQTGAASPDYFKCSSRVGACFQY